MAKPKNHGKDWSNTDVKNLRELAKKGATTSTIAKNLKRTTSAVRTKASEKKISLKPKDK